MRRGFFALTMSTITETALNRALIQWALSRPALIADTPTSIVYRVACQSGDMAALKVFKPGAEEERRGTTLLAWYEGEGAARVIAMDAGSVLLEWIEGQSLAEIATKGDDDQASRIIAEMVGHLHRPRGPFPPGLITLHDHFAALRVDRGGAWPATARDLYGRAKGIALSLFDHPAPQRPLHGDLHHENILHSGRGWVVIDPKGLVGDPAYEVANAFLNPWAARDLVTDQTRIGRMADCFSSQLGFDRKRVLGYAAAHAALSACWDLDNGNPIAHQLAALPNLLAAWEQA